MPEQWCLNDKCAVFWTLSKNQPSWWAAGRLCYESSIYWAENAQQVQVDDSKFVCYVLISIHSMVKFTSSISQHMEEYWKSLYTEANVRLPCVTAGRICSESTWGYIVEKFEAHWSWRAAATLRLAMHTEPQSPELMEQVVQRPKGWQFESCSVVVSLLWPVFTE